MAETIGLEKDLLRKQIGHEEVYVDCWEEKIFWDFFKFVFQVNHCLSLTSFYASFSK